MKTFQFQDSQILYTANDNHLQELPRELGHKMLMFDWHSGIIELMEADLPHITGTQEEIRKQVSIMTSMISDAEKHIAETYKALWLGKYIEWNS